MVLKLAFSLALLTAIGAGTAVAQTTPPAVRNPALGDPGAKPPPPMHKPRFKPVPKPQPASGNGNAPDRAAAGGGGR